MTIEEEFYKCFGIEPKIIIPNCIRCWYGTCVLSEKQCKKKNKQKCKDFKGNEIEYQYPPISDKMLLELICILNKHYSEHYQIASMIVGKNIEEVKKSILNDCIEQCKHKDFKHQVQSLFKGVGNE